MKGMLHNFLLLSPSSIIAPSICWWYSFLILNDLSGHKILFFFLIYLVLFLNSSTPGLFKIIRPAVGEAVRYDFASY
jgi:membrane-bound metal-dependent hydrolase YbcI (DUF457 family)